MRNNLCIATPTNGLPFIPFSRICSQLARTKRLCHIADKPGTQIQHCIPHVGRFANAKLTQRPKTPTGQELRLLIRKMFAVCSRQENQQWINTFARWNRKYYAFLAERSDNNITDGKKDGGIPIGGFALSVLILQTLYRICLFMSSTRNCRVQLIILTS